MKTTKIGNLTLDSTDNLIIVGNKEASAYFSRAVQLFEGTAKDIQETKKWTEVVFLTIIPNVQKVEQIAALLHEHYDTKIRDKKTIRTEKGLQVVYFVTQ